jgi:type IV pilus assembly protein PilM
VTVSGLVGVDIGSSAVRVVRVSHVDDDGYAVVDRFGVSRMREGAVLAGTIKSPQTVAMAIASALKAANVSGYGAVVGLPSANVALALQSVPSAVARDARVSSLRALNRQISPTLPLATSDLAVSYVRTDVSAQGVRNDLLTVAAAARADLAILRQVCSLAKVTPRAIDLSAAGTLRALYRGGAYDEDTASLVDIGATKVTIATRQGPHLRSLRIVSGGGSEVTRALMREADVDLEEAERRKRTMSLPDADRLAAALVGEAGFESGYGVEDVAQTTTVRTSFDMTLMSMTDSLIEQVAQALDNHAVTYGSYPQGVVLCGGGALLKGLKERMGQRLGVDVHLGAPWARVARGRRTETLFAADGTEAPQQMLELATAIGLATWEDPQ